MLKVVLDQTGITGEFNYAFDFSPPPERFPKFNSFTGPSIFTVLERELGLKLEPSRARLEVLVIDHVERPSEN